jgi:hypothetical protein
MVAPTYASPNIGNYFVGRGFLQMQIVGEVSYVDMGNCTSFELVAKPTLLEHYSSRVGVRTKDLVVVNELSATLTMSLEEITARNMATALLGTAHASGSVSIDMLDNPLFYAAIKFTGTNVVGPKWNFTFPLCILTPSKAVSLISQGSGTWGTIDLQADVLKDPVTGKFGTATSADFT